jgi:hypothetical protein
MARGNSRAQSELPSGYEAGRSEIDKLNNETYATRREMKYAANWEKTADFKVSKDGFSFGDGVAGNGIFKDGQLHLRDEDIEAIVEHNFVDDYIDDTIGNGGGDETTHFTPFAGENNLLVGKEAGLWAAKVEITSRAHDYPDSDEAEMDDYTPYRRGSREDPPEYASGTFVMGPAESAPNWIQIDYEKVMEKATSRPEGAPSGRLTLERDSAERLSKAIEEKINARGLRAAERKAEEYDWDGEESRRREERSIRDWEDRRND